MEKKKGVERLRPGSFSSPAYNSPPLNQLLNQITTIKLDRNNFLLWKNLALLILRSYCLEGHLIGEDVCPPMVVQSLVTAEQSSNLAAPTFAQVVSQRESTSSASGASSSSVVSTVMVSPLYKSWIATDQLLLDWLYNSMTV